MPAGAYLYLKNGISEQWHARRAFLYLKMAFLSSNMPAGAFLYLENCISEQQHARRGFFVPKKLHFWAVTCPQGLFWTWKIGFLSSNMPAGAFYLMFLMFYLPKVVKTLKTLNKTLLFSRKPKKTYSFLLISSHGSIFYLKTIRF